MQPQRIAARNDRAPLRRRVCGHEYRRNSVAHRALARGCGWRHLPPCALRSSLRSLSAAIAGRNVSWTCHPGKKRKAGRQTPLGSKPSAPLQPRVPRWPWKGSEIRRCLEDRSKKDRMRRPRRTEGLNTIQPEVSTVSSSFIRRMPVSGKGSVARLQQSALFAAARLTAN